MKFFKAVKFSTFAIYTDELTDSEWKNFEKSDDLFLLSSKTEKNIQYDQSCKIYYLYEWTEYYVSGLKNFTLNNRDFFFNGSVARNNIGIIFYKNYIGESRFREQVFHIKSHKIDSKELTKLLQDIDKKVKSSISLAFSSQGISKSKFTNDFGTTNYYIYHRLFNELKQNKLMTHLNYVSKNPSGHLEKVFNSKPIELVQEITPDSIIDIFSGGTNLKKIQKDLRLSQKLKGKIPMEINEYRTRISFDNAENRFIKYFIKYSVFLLNEFLKQLRQNEAENTVKNISLFDQIEKYRDDLLKLSYTPFFQNISTLSVINHANTILTRGNGYKQIYSTYINLKQTPMNFFNGNSLIELFENKSIDKLYEYICLFKLVEILYELYENKPLEWQWEKLKLVNKNFTISVSESNEQITFIFKNNSSYPKSQLLFQHTFKGSNSYSVEFRPDFTWQIFTEGKVLNYHFDAKFKLVQDKDKNQTSKNNDLTKMHSYRDGIKNTVGCFVLFPGTVKEFYLISRQYPYEGIGAFPIQYNKNFDSEIKNMMHTTLSFFKQPNV